MRGGRGDRSVDRVAAGDVAGGGDGGAAIGGDVVGDLPGGGLVDVGDGDRPALFRQAQAGGAADAMAAASDVDGAPLEPHRNSPRMGWRGAGPSARRRAGGRCRPCRV